MHSLCSYSSLDLTIVDTGTNYIQNVCCSYKMHVINECMIKDFLNVLTFDKQY